MPRNHGTQKAWLSLDEASFAEETSLVRAYTSTLGIERSLEGWTDSSSC